MRWNWQVLVLVGAVSVACNVASDVEPNAKSRSELGDAGMPGTTGNGSSQAGSASGSPSGDESAGSGSGAEAGNTSGLASNATEELGAGTDAGTTVAPNCGAGDVLVRGSVVRISPERAFNGPVVFGPESFATIQLFSNPSLLGGGTSTLIAEQTLRPAPDAPFAFCVTGSLDDVANDKVSYHVDARVQQQSDMISLGDLVSEVIHQVTEFPAEDRNIEVSGLESCDAPDSGGFCFR